MITFSQVYPWWQGLFNTLLPPQVDSAETFNEGYIAKVHPEWGAGPFKIDKVDFKTGVATFVRNDKWWGDEPKLDKVTYRVRRSP